MPIAFHCKACNAAINAPERAAGRQSKCPNCGNVVTVPGNPIAPPLPAPASKPAAVKVPSAIPIPPSPVPSPAEPPPEYKQCPYCSEKILATARKCKHCGEMLDPALRAQQSKPGVDAEQAISDLFPEVPPPPVRSHQPGGVDAEQAISDLFSEVPPPPVRSHQPLVPEPDYPRTRKCPFCMQDISVGALKCQHCGEFLTAPQKSDALAGCLGFLLGPVGQPFEGVNLTPHRAWPKSAL